MTTLTRESIVDLLKTSDKAVCRALVVLYNNQTADEQESNTTSHNNGRGFSGFDAEIGTNMVKNFYLRRGFLTSGQIAVWRKTDGNGNMRIAKYWRQLLAAAEAKIATQNVAATTEDTSFNYGYNAR